MMKLSVLINNYNYAQYLRACIDSVLSQDHAAYEIIVVDDGSTDDSRSVIASYGDAITPVLKANGGQASSFNAGFAASSGDILMMLDADDYFLPGKLAQVATIYSSHKVGWCFDRVTNEEDAGIADPVVLTPIDKRETMRAGGFPTLPVPTSGLTFHRSILSQILPMPLADDVVLSDNYLKFAAAYLAPGMLVETPLTFQRLHATNRYTNTDRAKSLKPQIMMATGLHLARRFDGLGRMGKSLVTGGIADAHLGLTDTLAEIDRVAREARGMGWTRQNLTTQVVRKRLTGAAKSLLGR
ncbi:glycosyltransferase family 2 protein [Sphingomonas sp. Leaf257]|jgi:glycosyltransferase involved in cell wall biosynthesis|uniref:glycosyltransferase family 2 protein n=1 Tax=Sphingomonas sp. Leaf257 TaxID=1736309 RepID=UPI0006FA009E|nr:glycosyltransferase [Sphingomonas sp. Leaf257]KQO57259.1 glycosyl transferase [Sphingomonas sp. Leaf257]